MVRELTWKSLCSVQQSNNQVFKLTCQFLDTNVQILDERFGSVKDIKKRLGEMNANNQETEVSEDTLNALLAPIDSQETLPSQQLQQQPLVSLYPSNLDDLILQPEGREDTSHQEALLSQQNQTSISDDGQSQVFFTCPEPHPELRMSPSSEKESNHVVGTNTNFPWTTIEELRSNTDENSTSFRIQGYVRKVHTTSNFKQRAKE